VSGVAGGLGSVPSSATLISTFSASRRFQISNFCRMGARRLSLLPLLFGAAVHAAFVAKRCSSLYRPVSARSNSFWRDVLAGLDTHALNGSREGKNGRPYEAETKGQSGTTQREDSSAWMDDGVSFLEVNNKLGAPPWATHPKWWDVPKEEIPLASLSPWPNPKT
jgi:hypothetical protein